MYPAGGSDIFIYPRGLFGAVPQFAIGRGYWDNWLMWKARQLDADLIDLTAAVTAVHQIHSYDTVAGLPPGGFADKDVFRTDEGRRNLEFAGGGARLYTVFDATAVMSASGELVSTWRPHLVRRRAKAWLRRKLRARAPQLP